MKNKKYVNLKIDKIYTAYQIGLQIAKESYEEQKRMGCIPKESADYNHFIKPNKDTLIKLGIDSIEETNEHMEELYGIKVWTELKEGE